MCRSFGSPIMPLAVFALALAAFSIGTTEFIISGILLSVSHDLARHACRPPACWSPAMRPASPSAARCSACCSTRIPLKPAILGVMAIFALGQLLCALAPSYELLLARAAGLGLRPRRVLRRRQRRRLADSCRPNGAARRCRCSSAASPSPTSSACPAAPPSATPSAGASPSSASPCMARAVGRRRVLRPARRRPKAKPRPTRRSPLQARQLLHQEVWMSYLTIAIIMVGQLAFGTFQVAILTNVTGARSRSRRCRSTCWSAAPAR